MKQPSMASDLRTPEEEDNESMADYADGVGDGEMIIMKPPHMSVEQKCSFEKLPQRFFNFCSGQPLNKEPCSMHL